MTDGIIVGSTSKGNVVWFSIALPALATTLPDHPMVLSPIRKLFHFVSRTCLATHSN
jgi:hypothetical protein